MKKTNKIICILLAVLMLMTITTVSAFAASKAIWLMDTLSPTYVDYSSGVTQYYYYKQNEANSYLYKVTYSNMKNVTEVALTLGSRYFANQVELSVGTTDVDDLYGNHYYGPLITSEKEIVYASDLPKSPGEKLACLMDFEEIMISSNKAIVTFTCLAVNKSEWTWNGTSSATARFTSTDNKAYIDVKVNAKQTVNKAQNCRAYDQISYTVSVNFNSSTYTDTKTATGSAGPHAYTNSKCKYCSRVCSHGSTLVTVDAKAPTCTESGWDAYEYCTVCDYTTCVNIPINPNAHDIIIDKAIAPDCYNSGLTAGQHCSRCNGVTIAQETVPALEHKDTIVRVAEKAPDCTQSGWDAYEYCTACDYTTYVEINATGHSYLCVIIEPTCNERGYTLYTCECGDTYKADYVDKNGHQYESEIITPATHLKEGIETFTCYCGDTYTKSIPKLTEHTYIPTVTEPTCTTQGFTSYTCECGDTYKADYVDKNGHQYESEITTPATHLKEGVETFTCHCGDTYTKPVPKLTAHTYNVVIISPTCTKQGYTTYKCECGDSYVDNYVDMLGHDMGEYLVITKPTCISKGVEASYCSRCNYIEAKDIAMLQHTYGEYISDGKATCVTDGSLTAKCNYCDAVDTKPEKGAHKFDDDFTIDLDPTCTSYGQKSRHCLNCTEKTDITLIGKLAHTYSTITIEPNCTDGGHKIYACLCGYIYTETIPAKGHSFDGSACTNCDYDKADSCGCNCHKSGIANLIFKIILFFQKLFRTNGECACGVRHY